MASHTDNLSVRRIKKTSITYMVNLCAIAITDIYHDNYMIIFHKFVCFAERDNTTMKRFLILTAALINFMACSQGPILKIGLS